MGTASVVEAASGDDGEAALPDARELERRMEQERGRAAQVFRRMEESGVGASSDGTRSMPAFDVRRGAAPDPSSIAQQYRTRMAPRGAAGTDLLVFVSFSMPSESLLRLAEQAKRANGVLVFRGLAGATLRQMNERLQPLAKKGAAMQINPQAFSRFGVKLVPAFLLTSVDESCAEGSCDAHAEVIAGDVSLDYALERLAHRDGPLAQAARRRLDLLRGTR